MSLQARVHRRLQRQRHSQAAVPLPAPTGGTSLLDYLARGAAARGAAALQADARALLHSGEPLRLGLRAGELSERVGWFQRLLALSPADERDDWLRGQLAAAQRHPLAGSPIHELLDARLFDPALTDAQRLRLQALWLAVVAPGAVSLDAARREREQAEALALLTDWL
ncbi:MAG: hypothetical protein U1F53_19800 [Burkholderiaceae bacterium]